MWHFKPHQIDKSNAFLSVFHGLNYSTFRGGRSLSPVAWATGLVPDDRTDALENVTRTIGNLLDGYDIRLRPNFGG